MSTLDSPTQWFLLLLVAFLILFLMGYAAAIRVQQVLENPNDKERIYLEQLPTVAQLAAVGDFRIRMIELCGHLQAESEAMDVSSALSQAMAAFRQANIDAVHIRRNTTDELHFNRLLCAHCGSSLGKELGSIEITRMASSSRSQDSELA